MTLRPTLLAAFPVMLCTTLFATHEAFASPILIAQSQAVAGPRTDSGTGLCGNFTHFMSPMQPLVSKSDAVTYLNKPATDPSLIGRVQRLFATMNFRNGQVPSANGDFVPPTYSKDIFPYSIDQQAVPMGTVQNGGDINFAFRLRGYFNVPATLSSKTIDFGVNCDDACSLMVGQTQVVTADERISGRVIRQVSFMGPGLYPVELVHYQNGSAAYLEWSRTDVTVSECPNDVCGTPLSDPAMYPMEFNPIKTAELYSAIAGTNSSCQECGAAGMPACAAGNYCADGLCQACATPAACGPSCVACPASTPICSAGACVDRCANVTCSTGQLCDSNTGACTTPPACTTSTMCTAPQVCRPEGVCGSAPLTCMSSSDCPSGQLCNAALHYCNIPVAACGSDSDCSGTPVPTYCDTTRNVCLPKATPGGCRMLGAPQGPTSGAGWIPWAALLALGWGALRRRRPRLLLPG